MEPKLLGTAIFWLCCVTASHISAPVEGSIYLVWRYLGPGHDIGGVEVGGPELEPDVRDFAMLEQLLEEPHATQALRPSGAMCVRKYERSSQHFGSRLIFVALATGSGPVCFA